MSDLVTVEVGALCTEAEARELTQRIASSASELWALLLEAHDRKAWKALGYESWENYAAAEFDMSRRRAYQLIDQGRVIRAIGADVCTNVHIPEAHTRELAPLLPNPPLLREVWDTVQRQAQDTQQPITAATVRTAVKARFQSEAELSHAEMAEAAAGLSPEQRAALSPVGNSGWGRVLCYVRDLLNGAPEPSAFVHQHKHALPATFLNEVKAAEAWLQTLIRELEERS